MRRRSPRTVRALESIGRARLSTNFYFREFLYSETAAIHRLANIPTDPDLAIEAGQQLCGLLLEPLQAKFGRISIRSGFRSCEVNALCNRLKLSCASNPRNYARHIWDRRDRDGNMGAMATIVLPWFADWAASGGDWRAMAWWVHRNLPYSQLQFFPRFHAFNIGWRGEPATAHRQLRVTSRMPGRRSMANFTGEHAALYAGLLSDREKFIENR